MKRYNVSVNCSGNGEMIGTPFGMYLSYDDHCAAQKEKNEEIKCLNELIDGMNQATLKQEQSPTLHDRYTMAALSRLLAYHGGQSNLIEITIERSRKFADEAMKKREGQ